MTESHYERLIEESLQRFHDLYQKREAIDAELVKLRQFMLATVNMVPDEHRGKWAQEVKNVAQKMTAKSASLADSVRRVFEDHPNYRFSASMIRDMLLMAGFDFSSYTSNPLSSISTTLRRMAEIGELRPVDTEDGVSMYVRNARPKRKIKKTEIMR